MTLENMDKPTVLKMVREGWKAFQEVLARFDDAQMVQSHPPDGWSVQDMMAHITHWETFAWQRLQEAGMGRKPVFDLELDDAQLDLVNLRVLQAGRARTLADVKAEFARVHKGLVAELERLPEDPNDPWWALWPKPEVPWQVIVYNTADHYAEHLVDLRKWLE
jgi:hypothetical protein